MTQYPAVLQIAGTLDGTNGFYISGVSTGDYSGMSVSFGDVNGDGFADAVIGAPKADPHGTDSGATYVVFGKASGFPINIDLSTLNGTTGFRIAGIAAGDQAGGSVSAVGDINGDGFADVIIGARFESVYGPKEGAAYVVYGKASGFASNLDLSTLNGPNGFAAYGSSAFHYAGWSVHAAGDVNGDGFGDMIVSEPSSSLDQQYGGSSYVVFGEASGPVALDLGSLNGTNGFIITGENGNDFSGRSVSAAGDVNGDGIADLLVGADPAAPHGANSGAAYVVFGKSTPFTATLSLGALNGTNGFKISGAAAGDKAGYSVSSAGDVNGDGIADIIIGAKETSPHGAKSGASYVVFGKNSGFAGNLDLSTIDGNNGFKISGEEAGAYAGFSVSAAGDVNGDGFDDVVIGAPMANPNGAHSGAVYVVFGTGTGFFPANLDVSTLNGTDGFKIKGIVAGNQTGFSVTAGDMNGDGLSDLLFGAPDASPHGNQSGQEYVVFGRLPDTAVNRTGTAASQHLVGGDSGDVLTGGGGNDKLYGNGGDDILTGGSGNDSFYGGSGTDTVSYVSAAAGVTVSLAIAGPQNTVGAGTDTLVSIETLTGSNFADQLTASAAGSVLNGGAGVDAVSYQYAAAGVHVSLLVGGAQNTVGAGMDTLTSIEKLVGSAFADTLIASTTGSTLNGGPGGDDLYSGPGSDILNGGGASDFADYALATAGVTVSLADTAFQNTVGAGTDELVSIEKVVGSNFNDTITGDAGVNTLFGEGGDDFIIGGANGDYLFGNAGNDTLYGGAGQDSLTGGAGNDVFAFQVVTDTLTAHPDTILDFASGQDLIDLSAIDADTGTGGDQAFHLGGGGGHAGDIVVSAFDAGNNRTVVSLYVDNNVSVDAAIWLTGDHHTLAASDFVL